MKTTAAGLLLALGLNAFPIQGFAETFLVENGAASAQLKLAQEGAAEYRIVPSANATEPEKFAAEELVMFLKRRAEGRCS